MEKNILLQLVNIFVCGTAIILFIKISPKTVLKEVKSENIVAITNEINRHDKDLIESVYCLFRKTSWVCYLS